MKTLSILLLLWAAIPAFSQNPAQSADPAKVLYDTGTKDEADGRVERAKLTLLTLAATYPDDPHTAKVRTELGAIYMFLEAQAQAKAGQNRAAYITFRTVTEVYPDSPLAKLADETAKSLKQ